MSSNIWQEFRIAVVAGVVVDKLRLSKGDAWALAAHSSNNRSHSLWSVLLWSMPLLGSSQLMVENFQMGEPRAYGIIVGDGQEVSAINPLLTEWLFNRSIIPTGTCRFGNLTYGGSIRGQQNSLVRLARRHEIFSVAGITFTILILAFSGIVTSVSYFSPLFFFFLYVATLISNFYLASQSRNPWAGFTSDADTVQMLILAPGDRWAVLSGPRNLVKIITTGSHIDQHPSWIKGFGQYLYVAVLLSAGFLQHASLRDGVYIGCFLSLTTAAAWVRAGNFGNNPTIRGVTVSCVGEKMYSRRANLIEELSDMAKSDAWAYDSGLLTRRYVPEKRAVINGD